MVPGSSLYQQWAAEACITVYLRRRRLLRPMAIIDTAGDRSSNRKVVLTEVHVGELGGRISRSIRGGAIGKHPIQYQRLSATVRLMDAVDDVAYYLAEWYLPELTDESVDDVVARLDAAATSVSSEGGPVRLVVTLAVPTDEVLYGVFGAHSPDIVSRTCLQAGVPHQRLSGDIGTKFRHLAVPDVADSPAV